MVCTTRLTVPYVALKSVVYLDLSALLFASSRVRIEYSFSKSTACGAQRSAESLQYEQEDPPNLNKQKLLVGKADAECTDNYI